jgi:DNA polymerase-3 subunit gamma/tau
VTGAARELARNAELQRRENGVFDLVVPKAKSYLAERNYVDKLKAALDQHLGGTVRVNVAVGETAGATAASLEAGEREARRAEAVKAVQGDGFVQELVNIFDAKVVDSSIRDNGKVSGS